MSLRISTLTRRAFPAVLVAASALNPAVAEAVPVGATGGTVVPLRSILRACDFSPIPGGASTDPATASAVIRATGGTVAAEVHLAEPGSPGTHYDVSLIQVASGIEFAMRRSAGSGRRGWRSRQRRARVRRQPLCRTASGRARQVSGCSSSGRTRIRRARLRSTRQTSSRRSRPESGRACGQFAETSACRAVCAATCVTVAGCGAVRPRRR